MVTIKKLFIMISAAVMLLFAGCGTAINYDLPTEPIVFNTSEFVNPADKDDGYLSIEYNGRTYIPYGTIKNSIDGDDIGECLGYIAQDGKKDENARVYRLRADSSDNYLADIYVGGEMDQPIFYRAADTAGKDITTPDYIDSLDYKYWQK